MTKQTIEVDIPDGWEFVRYGERELGESFMYKGEVRNFAPTDGDYIIVRPIEKWRIPTKLDLLNRDSIECRVRDLDDQKWRNAKLIAVAVNSLGRTRFYTGFEWWNICEIRDTEPNSLECWIRFNANGFHIFCYERPAFHEGCDVRHFVEVPE